MDFQKRRMRELKPDMTPMIDIVFQLIAFFTVVITFSEADQNQAVKLPSSELAKPPEGALETPRFIHVLQDGKAIFAGEEMGLARLKQQLQNEKMLINATPGKSASEATVIIRADFRAQTGKVQEVIKVCQETGFEKFALRAKYEEKKRAQL